MYRLLSICLALFFVTSAEAQLRFDTLSTRPIGPGMTHTHVLERNVPWDLNIIDVDLTNPYVQMRAMAAQDRVGGRETVPSMATRQDREDHRVVAAINGDFFTTSWPVATHIQDGEIAYGPVVPGTNRPGVGFSATNRAMIEAPVFNSTVAFGDTSLVINGVNRNRNAGELILYNRYRGANTSTTSDGSEVAVRVVDAWTTNEAIRVVVEERRPSTGSTSIVAGGAVLSGQGARGAFLNNSVAVGDTLTLRLGITPGVDDLREMISGGPFIVRNGQVNVGPRGDGVDRHPRTVVGINEDGTRLFMVTVDGRQNSSAGMTLAELADFLVRIGVDRAMNLDGGGSTTLLLHGQIENSISGDLRPVANGLAVISLAPRGDLTTVRLQQRSIRLFKGEQISFTRMATTTTSIRPTSMRVWFSSGLIHLSGR
jgi:uncharacterized protein YigE (DUF2233 family)